MTTLDSHDELEISQELCAKMHDAIKTPVPFVYTEPIGSELFKILQNSISGANVAFDSKPVHPILKAIVK
jgi:hypothetical protein